MDRISKVPLELLDPEMKAIMRASDEALGGFGVDSILRAHA